MKKTEIRCKNISVSTESSVGKTPVFTGIIKFFLMRNWIVWNFSCWKMSARDLLHDNATLPVANAMQHSVTTIRSSICSECCSSVTFKWELISLPCRYSLSGQQSEQSQHAQTRVHSDALRGIVFRHLPKSTEVRFNVRKRTF